MEHACHPDLSSDPGPPEPIWLRAQMCSSLPNKSCSRTGETQLAESEEPGGELVATSDVSCERVPTRHMPDDVLGDEGPDGVEVSGSGCVSRRPRGGHIRLVSTPVRSADVEDLAALSRSARDAMRSEVR